MIKKTIKAIVFWGISLFAIYLCFYFLTLEIDCFKWSFGWRLSFLFGAMYSFAGSVMLSK